MSAPFDPFFTDSDLNRAKAQSQLDDALKDADDGELYLEYRLSESFGFDDGRLKQAGYDAASGFGLRAVADDKQAYAHSTALDHDAIKRAAVSVSALKAGHEGTTEVGAPQATNKLLYTDANPLEGGSFEDKVKLLTDIDHYLRSKDDRVKQVSCSLTGEYRVVEILRPGGEVRRDVRPLVQLKITAVVGDGERLESAYEGMGGRALYDDFIAEHRWKAMADDVLRQGFVNLDAVPAPAGEMDVVLGPGWPGILLHEAVGHGLEGDFNRKGTSAFSGMIGERVASPGVTVVDDATIADRRGSVTIDDEGTPGQNTVLIEDGILKGYMHDRLNARLMGHAPTGNGRRQSFAHQPMPRMTNTYMLNGDADPGDMFKGIKRGLYAVSFGGGSVDIVSGKFVFNCTEAYKIEDGKVTAPVKGATLIGNGPDCMKKIKAVGNDMQLDPGVGVCGKNGQGVPVGVGQPSLLMAGLTVGGTGG
ncbi:tldD [Symbiodinium microadriaticum]|nr:tldD [Symbiodinium microadriaticum]